MRMMTRVSGVESTPLGSGLGDGELPVGIVFLRLGGWNAGLGRRGGEVGDTWVWRGRTRRRMMEGVRRLRGMQGIEGRPFGAVLRGRRKGVNDEGFFDNVGRRGGLGWWTRGTRI
jgi:hypothetical protein